MDLDRIYITGKSKHDSYAEILKELP